MAETVSTGGSMQFQYQKGHRPKPTKEFTTEIEEAYNEYYDRRKRERKQKVLIWIIIALIILIGLGIWWFSRN